MRVLVVKLSSLGDVIHTLAALTDAQKAIPGIRFDWVLEKSFAEIPNWHKAVDKVIPIGLRSLRKNFLSVLKRGELQQEIRDLRSKKYDLVIDAQGLLKSALVATLAKGKRVGLNWSSAREPLASLFYQEHLSVAWGQHAVKRLRQLFSQALGYALPDTAPDYGLDLTRLPVFEAKSPYCVLLHGTTWATKHWPEAYWCELANKISQTGIKIYLLWGDEIERLRAERIKAAVARVQDVEVLPRLNLVNLASVLAGAHSVIAVDTGLGHLACALDVPTLSLYGPTSSIQTGTLGLHQMHLSAKFECAPCLKRTCAYPGDKKIDPPCFASLNPETVLNQWILLNQ